MSKRLLLVSLCLVGLGIILSQNHCFVVLSGSMKPALPIGSLLYTRSGLLPEVGQVIVYRHPRIDALIAHRVTRIESSGDDHWLAWTQGDANTNGDTWRVTPNLLIGVVSAVITPGNLVAGVTTLVGGLYLLRAGGTYLSSK